MNDAPNLEPEPYVIPLNPTGTEALSFDATGRDDGRGWAAYHAPAVVKVRASVLLRVGPEDGPPGTPAFFGGEPRLVFPANHADAFALEVRELRIAVGPKTAGLASPLLREIPFARIEAAINHPDHRRWLNRRLLPANAVSTGESPGGLRYQLPPEPTEAPPVDMKIEDPGGYRKPDEFYQVVADRYLRLAAISPRPAQDLAAANGAPAATVHRWIREAKARGLLLLPGHRSDDPDRPAQMRHFMNPSAPEHGQGGDPE